MYVPNWPLKHVSKWSNTIHTITHSNTYIERHTRSAYLFIQECINSRRLSETQLPEHADTEPNISPYFTQFFCSQTSGQNEVYSQLKYGLIHTICQYMYTRVLTEVTVTFCLNTKRLFPQTDDKGNKNSSYICITLSLLLYKMCVHSVISGGQSSVQYQWYKYFSGI